MKLQHKFTQSGLERFRPYCPGIKTLSEDNNVLQESQTGPNETSDLEPHDLSEHSSHEDDQEEVAE
ncbi:hypothetical protein MJO29_006293 [Puccinia striiformis f. sp. tritici]|nr:hypothetical protein MJO29_006293 [Puccinia striiformis f. sp. tritici]